MLLTDPFLQRPHQDTIQVAWFTEFRGDRHLVLTGDPVEVLSEADVRRTVAAYGSPGVTVVDAGTVQLSRVAEDADSRLPGDRRPVSGIVARDVYRHHGEVAAPAGRTPYRVVSIRGDELTVSDTFTLPGALGPEESAVIMLTSDHQLTVNTPANLEFAARTITEHLGRPDAVFLAGDMVNIPDRASEWFDDARGAAFFPAMQGRGTGTGSDGRVYRGGQILQHAVLYAAVGNHEVQGRRDGHAALASSFENAVPRAVAEAVYAGDPAGKAQWVEDNSFSIATFQEIFALPGPDPFYAVTVGGVRLIVLFATRVWRGWNADPEPAARVKSRYQESHGNPDPLSRGYGAFLFEDLGAGSPQYEWLRRELRSAESTAARYRVVMLHEGPHGLGENVVPRFAHPVPTAEHNAAGEPAGIRYDYPASADILCRDVVPLMEEAGVNLVYSGHSHLWNRFVSAAGVNYLEASNTGNSFGAFHRLTGRSRPVPPLPWSADSAVPQGDPGGLQPVVPTVAPRRDGAGRPLPYIADGNLVVFQALHTGTGTLTSWYVDMSDTGSGAVRFDEFTL
ncbi:hypothetical protein V4U86_15375 [Mycobacterium sp. AMU20-3851]|uniref:metallophosphoesterase family protein n=1 Tax=Mycobacterium sp. AMU20-3851 TaxID=3122055 RepID=UPI003754EF3A